MKLFIILGCVLFFARAISQWVWGYTATCNKLQARFGGRVRSGWLNYPQFMLPQDEGRDEIVVSAYPTSGSRIGDAHATTCLPDVPSDRFSVVSRKQPHTSMWTTRENWYFPEDPDFTASSRHGPNTPSS